MEFVIQNTGSGAACASRRAPGPQASLGETPRPRLSPGRLGGPRSAAFCRALGRPAPRPPIGATTRPKRAIYRLSSRISGQKYIGHRARSDRLLGRAQLAWRRGLFFNSAKRVSAPFLTSVIRDGRMRTKQGRLVARTFFEQKPWIFFGQSPIRRQSERGRRSRRVVERRIRRSNRRHPDRTKEISGARFQ